jgi:MGT family glycosyltransferase
MARVLVYTSPARGHLFPILGPATELAARGHDVHVLTLSDEVELVRSLGLGAEPIDARVEAREMDDYKGRDPREALSLGLAAMADRAPHDHDDLAAAITRHGPDVLVVDDNSWGAQVAAEASGLPWCGFQPFFTPLPSRDVPPFGPGLRPDAGLVGRVRDRVLGRVIMRGFAKAVLPTVNELRARDGLAPLRHVAAFLARPPRTIYFTAEPLEYPRSDWPGSFVMVGPATWSPPASTPAWLDDIDRRIVLVTCSTELQADRDILENALAGLADEDVFVVGTSAAQDPSTFDVGSRARVERFLPHDAIVDRAVAVVCHGGMGITQRALSKGVPVCVVPHGRDQHEVARRVERAGAGVRLLPRDLTPESLREAVQRTRTHAAGAARVAQAFRAAGGAERAADVVEELVVEDGAPNRVAPDGALDRIVPDRVAPAA